MGWQIVYWENNSGRSPAREFLNSLPEVTRVKVRNLFRLMLEFGFKLGMPHMKLIKGYKPLVEFRIVGESSLRILGFFDKPYVVVLHAFRKKSQKIPHKEVDTAHRRWQKC